jgi:hypothetical protein
VHTLETLQTKLRLLPPMHREMIQVSNCKISLANSPEEQKPKMFFKRSNLESPARYDIAYSLFFSLEIPKLHPLLLPQSNGGTSFLQKILPKSQVTFRNLYVRRTTDNR